jgi:hypothetical protein
MKIKGIPSASNFDSGNQRNLPCLRIGYTKYTLLLTLTISFIPFLQSEQYGKQPISTAALKD